MVEQFLQLHIVSISIPVQQLGVGDLSWPRRCTQRKVRVRGSGHSASVCFDVARGAAFPLELAKQFPGNTNDMHFDVAHGNGQVGYRWRTPHLAADLTRITK